MTPEQKTGLHGSAGAPLCGLLAQLERVLQIDQVNDLYSRALSRSGGVEPGPLLFLGRLLEDLQVRYRLATTDLARIPRSGPLLVVSNHPFGALDGMVLAALIGSVRQDVKVMANSILGRAAALRDLFIFVNPFGGSAATAHNSAPVRQSIRWLKSGGVLVAFPAGEVAHLSLRDRRVIEPAWNDTIARIVRRTGASVLPVWFDGTNSPAFHLAGLLHPKLRTALLPRELFLMRNANIGVRIGSAIPNRRLAAITGDRELCDYLRNRTLVLRHGSRADQDRGQKAAKVSALPQILKPPTAEPLIPPVDPELLEAEIRSLPADALLLEHDAMQVLHARAPQIRQILREIGRLREITFRAAGEGTGKSIDLDTFDYDYIHLFVWNSAAREIVGAYRLGATDELLPAKGRLGLYSSTLFRYKPGLLERINPALEMGRSFVRAEYQRSYAPLLLLWKGIGRFVVRHPRYRHLFGLVSISNDYQGVSRQLMVRFLKLYHSLPDAAGLVRPRNPFRPRLKGLWDDLSKSGGLDPRSSDELSEMVAELEPDSKGIPVLLRQYLKLGAKILDFNLDPAFSNALDALIVVDLTRTDPRVLDRYMGRDEYQEFLKVHRKTFHHAALSHGN